MRTWFEEVDTVQEKESDGYFGKFAFGMIAIIDITLLVGFIKWELS